MGKTEEKRKIPTRNYVILFAIFASLVLLVIYLCNWYHVYSDYQKDTPVIRGVLSEITREEMDHYMSENPNAILYLCTSADDVCRDFEQRFAKLIESDNLHEDITYLNLSDIDQNQFIDEFNSKYNYRVKLTSYYPAIIVFSDNRVVDLLQGKKDDKLTMKETEKFLETYRIEE